jgi:hypothetical protein
MRCTRYQGHQWPRSQTPSSPLPAHAAPHAGETPTLQARSGLQRSHRGSVGCVGKTQALGSSRVGSMLASLARESGLVAARAFSTSAAAQAAVPAVAKRSFLAQLFGSGSRVDVPLTDALPGVEIPQPIAPSKEAPTTQLTKLSNGATIATENTPVRAVWARPAPPTASHGY